MTWPRMPLLTTALLLIATFSLWYAVKSQERVQYERVVRLAADTISADISEDMQMRVGDLALIAELWHGAEEPTRQQFEMHSTLYIGRDLGCVGLAFIGPSSEAVWAIPSTEDDLQPMYFGSDIARRAFEQARNTHTIVVSREMQHYNHRVLSIWAPVYVGTSFRGSVVSVFRVEPMMNSIVAENADLGYSVSISDGSEPMYTLHPGSLDGQRTWGQTAQVALPGRDWQVLVWPESGRMPNIHPFSTALLVGGLMLSGLVAAIIVLAQKTHAAAQIAEDTNRKLTREVVARRRAEESLHALSGRLLKVQDEERQYLARILHEGMAQKLFGLSMNLKLVSKWAGENPDLQAKIQQNIDLADECVCEMRGVTHLLHPPSLDVLGLVAALDTLAQGFKERTGIEVFTDFPDDLGRLSQDMEMALFRIVQESLNNVHRHSGSPTALVRLTEHEGLIVLEIQDEGRGMDTTNTHVDSGVGIGGMKERMWQLGGELQIESSAHGTTVRALLPHLVARDASESVAASGSEADEA